MQKWMLTGRVLERSRPGGFQAAKELQDASGEPSGTNFDTILDPLGTLKPSPASLQTAARRCAERHALFKHAVCEVAGFGGAAPVRSGHRASLREATARPCSEAVLWAVGLAFTPF